MKTCKQNEAAAALRHAVELRVFNLRSHFIIEPLENCLHLWEPEIVSQSRDILHHDCFGLQALDKTQEFKNKIILFVPNLTCSIQTSHGAESLARRASCKQVQFAGFQIQIDQNPRNRKLPDIFRPDVNLRMIRQVSLNFQVFDFDGTDDIETCHLQAQREAPTSGKEINGFRFHYSQGSLAIPITDVESVVAKPWLSIKATDKVGEWAI